MMNAHLASMAQFVHWVRSGVLPLWRKQAINPQTGIVYSAIDQRGAAHDSEVHSVSLILSMYILARAERLGWMTECFAEVRGLSDFLCRHATLPCRSDGLVRHLTADLTVVDDQYYVWEHACFMLASGAAADAYGYRADNQRAVNIFNWVERRYQHSSGGWFECRKQPFLRSSLTHWMLAMACLNMRDLEQKLPKFSKEKKMEMWMTKAKNCLDLYQQGQLTWEPNTLNCFVSQQTEPYLWLFAQHLYELRMPQANPDFEPYRKIWQDASINVNGWLLDSHQQPVVTVTQIASILAGLTQILMGDESITGAVSTQIEALMVAFKAATPWGVLGEQVMEDDAKSIWRTPETIAILLEAARAAEVYLQKQTSAIVAAV